MTPGRYVDYCRLYGLLVSFEGEVRHFFMLLQRCSEPRGLMPCVIPGRRECYSGSGRVRRPCVRKLRLMVRRVSRSLIDT